MAHGNCDVFYNNQKREQRVNREKIREEIDQKIVVVLQKKSYLFRSMANIHSTNKWLCFIPVFGNGTELGLFQFKIVWFFFFLRSKTSSIHVVEYRTIRIVFVHHWFEPRIISKIEKKNEQNCFFVFVFLPCHPIWDSTQNTFHHSQVLTIIVRLK